MTINMHSTVGDGAFRRWAEERLRLALGRFAQRLGAVSLRVSDANGPRGGVDKQGRAIVTVRGAGNVVIDDADASKEALVARIADRLSFAVARAAARASRPL